MKQLITLLKVLHAVFHIEFNKIIEIISKLLDLVEKECFSIKVYVTLVLNIFYVITLTYPNTLNAH